MNWKPCIGWFIVLFSYPIVQFAQVVADARKNRAWKASYNTGVRNIFRKRASKLIPRDSYMYELGRFFSFYPAAYLATKFPILMEIPGRASEGDGKAGPVVRAKSYT